MRPVLLLFAGGALPLFPSSLTRSLPLPLFLHHLLLSPLRISIADASRQCRALTGISFSTLAADCRVFSFLSSFLDLFLRSPRTLCFDPLFLLLLLLLLLLLCFFPFFFRFLFFFFASGLVKISGETCSLVV